MYWNFYLRYSLSFPCNTIQNIRIEVRDFEKKKPKTFFGWKDLKTKTLGYQSIALENKECLCANGIYKNLEMYTKKGGRWTQLNRIRKRTDHVSLETKCDQVIRKCQQDLKQNVSSWFNKTQLISLQSWVLCFAKNGWQDSHTNSLRKRTRPMETNKDILKLGNSRFQLILRMLQQVQEQMKL